MVPEPRRHRRRVGDEPPRLVPPDAVRRRSRATASAARTSRRTRASACSSRRATGTRPTRRSSSDATIDTTGEDRFIYHGNDGTSMPWNDTAQLDYTKAEVRHAVIETILHVARMFPIIRFDAAMTLAKRHIQRLWFPLPGQRRRDPVALRLRDDAGGVRPRRSPSSSGARSSTPSRQRAPDTLLLAEAFWMMEGYFVRTLGMHRVYNSAFMNMLKREENEKYRADDQERPRLRAGDPQALRQLHEQPGRGDGDRAVRRATTSTSASAR